MKEYISINHPELKANALKIQIDYELGGYNYFSGQRHARGVYFYITPVDKGDIWESAVLLGGQFEAGYKILLEELPRKSQKKIDQWSIKIQPRLQEIADLFLAKKHKELRQLVLTGSYELVY